MIPLSAPEGKDTPTPGAFFRAVKGPKTHATNEEGLWLWGLLIIFSNRGRRRTHSLATIPLILIYFSLILGSICAEDFQQSGNNQTLTNQRDFATQRAYPPPGAVMGPKSGTMTAILGANGTEDY